MYVRVHAMPRAKKERVTKISETEFYIAVREKPERNEANRRIIEVLAAALSVSPLRIKMLTGHRSPSKMFSIEA